MALKGWFFDHVRLPLGRFTYVSVDGHNRGRNGIVLRREPSVSMAPSVVCDLRGAVVNLKTEGTPGLRVRLGEGGLGLRSAVEVFWNGVSVYRGEPINLELGTGP